MKTSRIIISTILAAGAPGTAIFALAGLVPAEIALSVLSVTGLLAFAAFDYSRTAKKLALPVAPVLRPSLPVSRPAAATAGFARRAA